MSGWKRWADPLLAAVIALLAAQEAYVGAGGSVLTPQVAAAALAGATLPLRHRFPALPAVLATGVAAVLGIVLPLVVVLFSFAARERLVAAVLCAAVAMAGNLLLQPQHTLWETRAYGPALLLVAVLALGMWTGGRRRLVAGLAAQVEHLRMERELRAERARLTERARLAAELHDSLAHSLSVLALHTGALQRHSDRLPEHAAERIDLMRATSTEALRDLRDVLGSLREPETEGQPGPQRMRDLPELLAEARAADQCIDAEITGDPASLPFSHRLAIYRVVQEGLTNARKHAPGADVQLRVRHGPPESIVQVDSGRSETAASAGGPESSEPDSGGYGLVGLAERISALGGELERGPAGSGGWRLAARIPSSERTGTE